MKQGHGDFDQDVCRARGQRSPLMSWIAMLSQCYVAYYVCSSEDQKYIASRDLQ